MLGFINTARTTREFPTDATMVINIEDEAVEKDKYDGAVMFSHGYFQVETFSAMVYLKTASGPFSCNIV